jgi:hypothetical protein
MTELSVSTAAASTKATAAALAYIVSYLHVAVSHYGKRYLVGGDLHPDTIDPGFRLL